jgi:chromosome segregation ATPase
VKKFVWTIIAFLLALAFLGYYAYSMTVQAQNLRAEIGAARAQMMACDQAATDAQVALDAANGEIQLLTDENAAQAAELARLQAELSAREAEIADLTAKIGELERECADAEDRLALATAANTQLTDELKDTTAQLAAERETAATKDREIELAHQQTAAAQSEADAAALKAEGLQLELDTLKGKLADLEKMLDDAQAELDRLKAQ